MKVRTTLVVAGWLTLMAACPTPAADGPRGPAPEVGRYQAFPDKNGRLEHLLDTATGQVWYNQNAEWSELVSPPKEVEADYPTAELERGDARHGTCKGFCPVVTRLDFLPPNK